MRDAGCTILYGIGEMVMRKQYVGIRYNATGVSGYSFRKDGTEVFRVSCPVMPKPDILLSGFGKTLWHRNYDGQITLCPGVRRNVTDESGSVRGYYEIERLGNSSLLRKAPGFVSGHPKRAGIFLPGETWRRSCFACRKMSAHGLRRTGLTWKSGSGWTF